MQPELQQLLYPIFVQIYLQLINFNATSEAHSLFSAYQRRFIQSAEHPALRKARETELHSLSSLSSKEQLDDNAVAIRYHSRKYPINLSRYSYDMMLHYIRCEELLLILAVMNHWLAIEVLDTPVAKPAAPDAAFLAALGGSSEVDAAVLNQLPLDLRLLENSLEHRYEEIKAERAEKEATSKLEDESLTRKQRSILLKDVDAAKLMLSTVKSQGMPSKIPLPSVQQELATARLEEIEHREKAGAGEKAVSVNALPSAAMLTFINARHTLNCMAFSRGTKYVLAGFADSSIRRFRLTGEGEETEPVDVTTMQTKKAYDGNDVFLGHSGPVYGVDISPDDRLLISCSADGTVRLWSTEISAGVAAFKGHLLPVWDTCFACEYGHYFATGGADRTVRIWNTERTEALRIFAGHQGDADVVTWHPNIHYLASGSSDRSVRLWDVRSGNCCRIFSGHDGAITSLAFSSDGSTLASADTSGVIRTWDLAMAQQSGFGKRHNGPVWSLSYSHGEGKLLASGGSDCTLRLWSESSGGITSSDGGTLLSCVASWYTKATPVVKTQFTHLNLLLAAGPLSLEVAKQK